MNALSKLRNVSHRLVSKYRLRHLAVFGSVARGDATAESDLDLIVEFQQDDEPGLADRFFDFQEEVKELFGCDVDIVTTRDFNNPYLKRSVEKDLIVLHG